MATPNLGLTEPTVGDDTGAWGTELNGDLSILDAAAAIGVVPISTSQDISFGTSPTMVYEVTTGAVNITVTLVAPSYAREIMIFKIDSGAGYVVIGGGGISYQLNLPGQFVRLYWNGSVWRITGGN